MGTDLLGIAVSGLKTSQAQISTTGHNITNANQEGYSRQRVNVGTNQALYMGFGFAGTGVNTQSIERIASEFVTTQIRLDSTSFSQIDAFSQKIGQVDSLLSNEAVGLSGGLSSFFGSMQAATDDPTSIPVRQLILAESDVLAQRFNSLYDRFNDSNNFINQEIDAIAGMITSLSEVIAGLNEAIVDATARSAGQPPNDLLDERDAALLKLSELVSVTTFKQSDEAVNVFIGNGQPLVVGQIATRVEAIPGQTDGSRFDIAFVNQGNTQVITDQFSGGSLGGVLDFRDDVLDRAFNELGRIALSISQAMNEQQSIGLDLNGNFGVPLFSDINQPQAMMDRIVPSGTNALPPDRVVSVAITDATLLENSDYTLSLTGTGPDAFELRRESDDELVLSGGLSSQRPTTIEYQGFTINIEQGSFADGDRFQVMPTRFAARDVSVLATQPEVLAFALPISTSNSLANTGSGEITQGDVLQTRDPITGDLLPAFANLGELSPPLLVHFTSATTYDILDVSDPANPKSLIPAIENQLFIPGQSNTILPSEPGVTLLASDGYNSNRIPRLAEVLQSVAIGTQASNTFDAEQLTISYTDPDTNRVLSQPNVLINAGDSAKDVAFQLTSREGVTASAYTETQIRVVDNGTAGVEDFNLYLNGVDIKNELALLLSPEPVPVVLTNDLIADAINNSAVLTRQDIFAVSDGLSITITARTGEDLAFAVRGDVGDLIQIKGDQYPIARATIDVSAGANLDAGGPNSFTIDLFDGPGGLTNPMSIAMEGSFSDPDTLISYLENEINVAYDVPGKVSIELQDDGTLNFISNNNGHSSQIQITALAASDPLGLTAAVAEGVIAPTDILSLTGTGLASDVNAATVAGEISMTMADGYSMTSDAIEAGNIFKPEPQEFSKFIGYSFDITGNPNEGDEFNVNFNEDGVSDNRNALKFSELELKQIIGGNSSFQESYGNLVEYVGTITGESNINREAALQILNQSIELRNSTSGVNLDEEAANLIRYELSYNASSKIISIASDLFDTLLAAF